MNKENWTLSDLMTMPMGEASIFVPEAPKSISENIEIINRVLCEAEIGCIYWGVDGNRVLVWTWLGRFLFTVERSGIVHVHFVPGEEVPNKEAENIWYYCSLKFFVCKEDL